MVNRRETEKMKKMNYRYLLPVLCFFIFCSQKEHVDRNLFGTWLVIGDQNRISGQMIDGNGYTVAEAFKVYRIDENYVTTFTRGYVSMFDGIQYYDTLRERLYTASFDGTTITMNDSIDLSYAVRSRCDAHFLKLTDWQSGIDITSRTSVTVEMNEYCIRVDTDSLPAVWPDEDDVIIPDPNCDPGDLIYW